MNNIKLELHTPKIKDQIVNYQNKVKKIIENLNNNYMTGWLDYPDTIQLEEIKKIKFIASKIQNQSDYLICIGIGGSYLGAKAVIDALSNPFENKNKTKVLYAGNNLDSDYIYELIEFIKDKDFSINVISKSGTTLEPSIAFRLFKNLLEQKYGEKSKERIIVTTDKEKGILKELSLIEDYETLIIPDNIGGRYSVLTPVGLLPIAVAGIDIDKLLQGLETGKKTYSEETNICYEYAITRYLLNESGKDIEILVSYNPKLNTFSEWWKQLFGESEGKDYKGLFPASVNFTTDLHSLGQYIQDGKRIMFETIINIENPIHNIKVPNVEPDLDKLNYLNGATLDYINKQAMQGTIEAHESGNVPNVIISINKLNEEILGELIYFFFLSCAISCSLNDLDPFNQPGVEKYKENMFRLLGKDN